MKYERQDKQIGNWSERKQENDTKRTTSRTSCSTSYDSINYYYLACKPCPLTRLGRSLTLNIEALSTSALSLLIRVLEHKLARQIIVYIIHLTAHHVKQSFRINVDFDASICLNHFVHLWNRVGMHVVHRVRQTVAAARADTQADANGGFILMRNESGEALSGGGRY